MSRMQQNAKKQKRDGDTRAAPRTFEECDILLSVFRASFESDLYRDFPLRKNGAELNGHAPLDTVESETKKRPYAVVNTQITTTDWFTERRSSRQ
jgi:hypothetical protein